MLPYVLSVSCVLTVTGTFATSGIQLVKTLKIRVKSDNNNK